MSPSEVKAARRTLGLSCTELAEMLRLSMPNGADSVRRWERGATVITGPASLALEALLDGWRPMDRRGREAD